MENLTKALIQFHFAMRPVVKDSKNPFFKSSYASLDAILDAIKGPLLNNGLTFVQVPERNGLTTRLMHESGEFIEATMDLMPIKQDPQSQGSAITYARRYALSAMLGLATEEDDDGNLASIKQIKDLSNNETDDYF